jgi:hypothetical protein
LVLLEKPEFIPQAASQPASHPLRTRESFSLRGKEIKEIKEEEPS